jgi:diketogulonate reductase-like aldo/keto reductase
MIGFGTMPREGVSVSESLANALLAGYRHIDTAESYENLAEIGDVINKSKVNRSELFITSKLKGLPCGEYPSVRDRVKKMLTDLKIERLDLLLIHWPGEEDADLTTDPAQACKKCDFTWFCSHIQQAWSNMLSLRQENLVRNIGVSNFYPKHMKELRTRFPEDSQRPFANQIYIDVCHQEREFVSELMSNNILVIAYRPLAFMGVYQMCEDMGDTTQKVLQEESGKLGITPHQLVIAFLMNNGIRVVCSSSSKEHLEANLMSCQFAEKISKEPLHALDGSEMVDMCGGLDEYARMFKQSCTPSP